MASVREKAIDSREIIRTTFDCTQNWGHDGRHTNAPIRAVGSIMNIKHYRLRPTMKQRTESSIPETWVHYESADEARAAAKRMYHDDRVLRVMLVNDGSGTFVEWLDR